MPTPTYIPLATYTVTGSPVLSVTFSSIPATYRDLILVIASPSTQNSGTLLEFNGDTTAANYSRVSMLGNGSSALSSSSASDKDIGAMRPNGTIVSQIMDYSATDKHKTSINRSNGAANDTRANANRWANTAAINSIAIKPDSGDIDAGTTLSIYGVN